MKVDTGWSSQSRHRWDQRRADFRNLPTVRKLIFRINKLNRVLHNVFGKQKKKDYQVHSPLFFYQTPANMSVRLVSLSLASYFKLSKKMNNYISGRWGRRGGDDWGGGERERWGVPPTVVGVEGLWMSAVHRVFSFISLFCFVVLSPLYLAVIYINVVWVLT